MPIKMGHTVQSVVIDDCIYVGGGDAGKDYDHDQRTVMKLDFQRDEWTKLPQYKARNFAMTSFATQLVLVGGLDQVTDLDKPINQIAVFTLGKWTNPYPPMNTACYCSTAVCFKSYIIVAGGHDYQSKRTTSVEVLDATAKRWYIAESLPKPRSSVKSTLIDDTLYLMGGRDHRVPTKVVHKVDLNDLITKAISGQAKPIHWQEIEDTPLFRSAPLSVGGSLLAVGGTVSDVHYNPSLSIHLYQPDTRRWVKVGDLPTARYYCTCSVLPNGEVIIAGGETGALEYTSTVDILSISNAYTNN